MSKLTIIEGNSNDKDNLRAFMVKGEPGDDGISPTASVSQDGEKAIITVTDASGTTTAEINAGVSPTVDVSKTGGITTITIEDVEGTHTATINDGETYEVPTNSVIGWAGTDSNIPGGYEQVEDVVTKNEAKEYIFENNSYSITEKKIGYWVDGKPLYEKTIDFGALPNNQIKNVAHNIQNLKRIVALSGFAGSGANKGGITLPHASSYPVSLFGSDTNVSVLTSNDATAYTQTYIFIRYTKTTD